MFKSSERTKNLKQSGIRAASVQCNAIGGINLGQGVCDIPTPDLIKQRAYKSIETNKNLYSPCEGILELREAIAHKLADYNKITVDSRTEVMVTHGSTGAFVSAITTLFNPGDEVILFEPFYGYHKNILNLHGMNVQTVPINLQDFSFDPADIEKVINSHTRGIVICTPCNPCGKVFSKEELITIGKIAEKHNLYVITDEIYEYITYPGFEHISPASLPDFKHRTITISGFSKTYNMTGWRLGYAAGPTEIISKMALVQDLIYVCPATPLQHGAVAAFDLDKSYCQNLKHTYLSKRDHVVTALREIGFKFTVPQGAYYILLDFSALGFKDDEQAAKIILEKAKVALVPGRAFYVDPAKGKNIVRVCYALDEPEIVQAMKQLKAANFHSAHVE